MTGVFTLPKSVLIRLVAMLEQYEEAPVLFDPISMGSQDDFESRTSHLFLNNSGETIPPFACMKIVGSGEDEIGNAIAYVEKPNSSGGPFMFNGQFDIEADELANGFTGEVQALCDTVPASGESWGPKSDWKVESDGDPAILIWGEASDTTVSGRSISSVASGLFVVLLDHVGGEDGSASTQCSWTYNITKVGNDEILEAGANNGVEFQLLTRMKLGKYEQATHGIACYLSGSLSVITSNEVPVASTC